MLHIFHLHDDDSNDSDDDNSDDGDGDVDIEDSDVVVDDSNSEVAVDDNEQIEMLVLSMMYIKYQPTYGRMSDLQSLHHLLSNNQPHACTRCYKQIV